MDQGSTWGLVRYMAGSFVGSRQKQHGLSIARFEYSTAIGNTEPQSSQRDERAEDHVFGIEITIGCRRLFVEDVRWT